jgi:CRISPR/Cas system CSM-associated protein Csm2 small subunit
MTERREPIRDLRDLGRALGRPNPEPEPRRGPPPRDPPRGGRGPGGPPPGRLPDGYLRDGYFDTDGYLRPELIVEQARAIADDLDRAGLSSAALRRFFGMLRKVETRLDAERNFAAVRGDLLALKPFAANAETRDVIPSLFRVFIDRNVDNAVLNERAFRRGFLPHFQYVVAYFPKK